MSKEQLLNTLVSFYDLSNEEAVALCVRAFGEAFEQTTTFTRTAPIIAATFA